MTAPSRRRSHSKNTQLPYFVPLPDRPSYLSSMGFGIYPFPSLPSGSPLLPNISLAHLVSPWPSKIALSHSLPPPSVHQCLNFPVCKGRSQHPRHAGPRFLGGVARPILETACRRYYSCFTCYYTSSSIEGVGMKDHCCSESGGG